MSVSDVDRMIEKTKSQIKALESKLEFYETKRVREKARAVYLAKNPVGQHTRGSSHWNRFLKKHDLESEFEAGK